MLDDSLALSTSLSTRYGHLLPDTLIRSTVAAADAPVDAGADVAALAEAVLRSPEHRSLG